MAGPPESGIRGVEWRPGAAFEELQLRAAMLRATRAFFAHRQVLEIETPVLCRYTTTDPHVQSLRLADNSGSLWLRTSPEHHMKRLLAAGFPDIYQLGKVFRADESGRLHQPEFTLIEWYRRGFDVMAMVRECCELIQSLSALTARPLTGFRCTRYRDAFIRACKLDPFTATLQDIRTRAMQLPGWRPELQAGPGNERGQWLDLLAGLVVYPGLGRDGLEVLVDYPAEQAMLARLKPDDPECAERFEVFLHGVELANGYRELTDPAELAHRLQRDNQRREASGLQVVEGDHHLLAAQRHGLPECAGVAAGFDRILLVTAGVESIDAVISFPTGG